jgi:hypothetical protein
LSSASASRLSLGGLAAAGGVYDLQRAQIPAIVAGKLSPAITNYNLTMFALFKPAFLRELAHPRGALLRALRANDTTCAWRPQVPVRLCASFSDEAVTPVKARATVMLDPDVIRVSMSRADGDVAGGHD